MIVETAEWVPDQAALGGGDQTAKNVIPWVRGYKPLPSMSQISTTGLTARCQGATFGRSSAAVTYDYAGDATKLYSLSGVTYSDASRLVGGAYATATDDYWEFSNWGETVIATNYADAPQVITMGGANFAALAGSPPKARHIAVVKDFVVLGNLNDGTARPNRLMWSGINDSTYWTIDANKQCDIQDLVGEGGWVQKIIGGEYGIVFQERAIWRMSYVGSPVIFQFDKVELNRGAAAAQSVIGWGDRAFYLADDGFYMIQGGNASIPIGDAKIDRTFLNDVKTDYLYRVNAAIDPVNKIVLWAYPGSGSVSGAVNKLVIYNWACQKWSYAEVDTEVFARYASTGFTLEGLDAVSSSIDALSTSLDSRQWTGGAQSLSAFNTSHQLSSFTGTAMAATVDTKEVQHNPAGRAYVSRVRPIVDGGTTVSVSIGTRNVQTASPTFINAVTADSNGECPVEAEGRYHRYRVTTSGAFNFILGVEPTDITPTGRY